MIVHQNQFLNEIQNIISDYRIKTINLDTDEMNYLNSGLINSVWELLYPIIGQITLELQETKEDFVKTGLNSSITF